MMRSFYLRGIFLLFLIHFGFSINAQMTKLFIKCAVPAVKYGLPALPLLYVAIKEGMRYFNRVERVENAVKEMHSTLNDFEVETKRDIQITKNEILKKIAGTKKSLKNLVFTVEENISDDIQRLDKKLMVKLNKMCVSVKNCATHKEVELVNNKLNTVVESIKRYESTIDAIIKDSEERTKKRFSLLSKKNDDNKNEIKQDIKTLSDKIDNLFKKIYDKKLSRLILNDQSRSNQKREILQGTPL